MGIRDRAGLPARGRWDRNEYGALAADVRLEDLSEAERSQLADFPTAWIPDCIQLFFLCFVFRFC